MKPHIIGIAGPSSSGKTELARRLVAELPGTAIVSLDSYYRGRQELPFEEREKLNFDHPDALEWELLQEHLQAGARHAVQQEAGLRDWHKHCDALRIPLGDEVLDLLKRILAPDEDHPDLGAGLLRGFELPAMKAVR